MADASEAVVVWPVRPEFWDRYELQQELGAGEFGHVHLVLDRWHPGRKYAVKQLFDTRISRELQMEVLALERVSREPECNEHVACIHGHYMAPLIDPPYQLRRPQLVPTIVMEFVPGENLADWRRRYWRDHGGPPGPSIMMSLMESALLGVAHLHAHNIAHRDLHNENIRIRDPDSAQPKSVLVDLGLSCIIDPTYYSPAGGVTCQSGWSGNPSTTSPEYARSELLDRGYVPGRTGRLTPGQRSASESETDQEEDEEAEEEGKYTSFGQEYTPERERQNDLWGLAESFFQLAMGRQLLDYASGERAPWWTPGEQPVVVSYDSDEEGESKSGAYPSSYDTSGHGDSGYYSDSSADEDMLALTELRVPNRIYPYNRAINRLLVRMLSKDARLRPTASEALQELAVIRSTLQVPGRSRRRRQL